MGWLEASNQYKMATRDVKNDAPPNQVEASKNANTSWLQNCVCNQCTQDISKSM